jgi:hypothetical protein
MVCWKQGTWSSFWNKTNFFVHLWTVCVNDIIVWQCRFWFSPRVVRTVAGRMYDDLRIAQTFDPWRLSISGVWGLYKSGDLSGHLAKRYHLNWIILFLNRDCSGRCQIWNRMSVVEAFPFGPPCMVRVSWIDNMTDSGSRFSCLVVDAAPVAHRTSRRYILGMGMGRGTMEGCRMSMLE